MTLLTILLSVLTTLTGGMFRTTYSTEVKAEASECNVVIDTLISQLQQDPQLLSDWAFAGLGKQSDSEKNAIYLVWKDAEYSPEKKYSKLLLDVHVDEKPKFKDVVIESQVDDTMEGKNRVIRVDIFYSGSLLDKAYGIFRIEPQADGTTVMAIETDIQFGWFFRIFVTKRIFSKNIDWRLERFVQNLKLTAEGQRPTDAYWKAIDNATTN